MLLDEYQQGGQDDDPPFDGLCRYRFPGISPPRDPARDDSKRP
jgi:hypothetical protein